MEVDPYDDPIETQTALYDYTASLSDYAYYRYVHNITKTRPAEGNSCPRCYSKRVKIGYPYIHCSTCKLTEPLIDFPASVSYLTAIREYYPVSRK